MSLDSLDGIREYHLKVSNMDPTDLIGVQARTMDVMLTVLHDRITELELEAKAGKTSTGGVETVPVGKRRQPGARAARRPVDHRRKPWPLVGNHEEEDDIDRRPVDQRRWEDDGIDVMPYAGTDGPDLVH